MLIPFSSQLCENSAKLTQGTDTALSEYHVQYFSFFDLTQPRVQVAMSGILFTSGIVAKSQSTRALFSQKLFEFTVQ